MKALLTMILGVVILRTCNTPSIDYAQPTPLSFQQFYDELSPYGDWVETPEYGYSWVPDVDDDFRPYYTNGNWVATDMGNTWQSDYPWGWAPFHYGNWAYTQPHGWTWVPGYDWAPAHVSWRQGEGYYGWAPLLPGLALNTALNRYNPPVDWWVFVPQARLYNDNVYRFWPGPQFNPTIFPGTTYITNVYKGKNGPTYIFGPRPNEYAKLTGKKIKVHKLVDVGNAKNMGRKKDVLHVYRPHIKKERGAAPTKVMQGWAGKARGNSLQPGNKGNDRGPQQNKALPGNKQNGKQMEARGRQNISPERKPSSPNKAAPRKAPQRQQPQARPAQQKNSGASARHQPKQQHTQRSQPRQQHNAPSGQRAGNGGNGGGGKGGGKNK
jgi:hypothetical protein